MILIEQFFHFSVYNFKTRKQHLREIPRSGSSLNLFTVASKVCMQANLITAINQDRPYDLDKN